MKLPVAFLIMIFFIPISSFAYENEWCTPGPNRTNRNPRAHREILESSLLAGQSVPSEMQGSFKFKRGIRGMEDRRDVIGYVRNFKITDRGIVDIEECEVFGAYQSLDYKIKKQTLKFLPGGLVQLTARATSFYGPVKDVRKISIIFDPNTPDQITVSTKNHRHEFFVIPTGPEFNNPEVDPMFDSKLEAKSTMYPRVE